MLGFDSNENFSIAAEGPIGAKRSEKEEPSFGLSLSLTSRSTCFSDMAISCMAATSYVGFDAECTETFLLERKSCWRKPRISLDGSPYHCSGLSRNAASSTICGGDSGAMSTFG